MTTSHVVRLAGDVTAARQARAFVRETVGDQVEPELLDDVLVATSELVSNAVMHGGTASELEVRLDEGTVEVRVSDGDPRLPERRRLLGGPSAQGRGLVLLGGLARRWGVEQRRSGKTVWAVFGDRP